MEKQLLNVGDVIYDKGNYGVNDRFIIERVSSTQAFSNHKKFKRFIYDGAIERIAQESWSTSKYYVETPALKDEWLKKGIVEKLRNFQWGKLDLDQLKAIRQIIGI